MLKKPSASVLSTTAKQPSAATAAAATVATAMEVESTRVHVLADGKKLIDVTMRRPTTGAHTKQEALVVPQFDDDSSSSDDSGNERHVPQHYAPVFSSPLRKSMRHSHSDDESVDDDNNNNNRGSRTDTKTDATKSSPDNAVPPAFEWASAGVGDIQQLTNANALLASQATEFKRQIKTLQIQLEVLAPVPGLSADVVQDILLERDSGVEHDIRDAKIVHQAKTLRQLKRALQREKQRAVDAVKQSNASESAKVQLERDVETLTLKATRLQARAAATAAAAATVNALVPSDAATLDQRDASSCSSASIGRADSSAATASNLKRKLDDLKAKHEKLQLENKWLVRALQREVGDDVALDDVLDGRAESSGKRGRAQQIVMLRAKVKKLQAELLRVTTTSCSSPSSGGPLSTPTNVDTRAQQDLTAQQTQRQKLHDTLVTERDALETKLKATTRTLHAVKSRVQTLETEKRERSSQFQVLVDKSQTDDALIDALQTQLAVYKTKAVDVKRARTAESVVTTTTPGMPALSEATQFRAMATEKERLLERIEALQLQLADKDRQLRQATQQQPPLVPPMVLPESATAIVSRIPRNPTMPMLQRSGMAPSPPQQQSVGNGSSDTASSKELETMRRAFRESLRAKDDAIADLRNRLDDVTQAHQSLSSSDANTLVQDVTDLQDENQFLRHEFEKLKTRYEALTRSAKAASKAT